MTLTLNFARNQASSRYLCRTSFEYMYVGRNYWVTSSKKHELFFCMSQASIASKTILACIKPFPFVIHLCRVCVLLFYLLCLYCSHPTYTVCINSSHAIIYSILPLWPQSFHSMCCTRRPDHLLITATVGVPKAGVIRFHCTGTTVWKNNHTCNSFTFGEHAWTLSIKISVGCLHPGLDTHWNLCSLWPCFLCGCSRLPWRYVGWSLRRKVGSRSTSRWWVCLTHSSTSQK